MRDWLILGFLIVAGGMAGRFQTIARNHGRPFLLGDVVQTVAAPIAGLSRTTADMGSRLTQGVIMGPQLVAENARLKQELEAANDRSVDSKRLSSENDRLKKLLGVDSMGRQRIPAQIVGLFAIEQRFTISAGSNQGVRVALPVVAADGLVGVVQVVSANRSEVLLLTSPVLQIGAIVDRDPPTVGMLQGSGTGQAILDFSEPNAPVSVGDRIITSGFSEKIPRGIEVGTVIEVHDEPAFGFRRATVFPAASIGATREVVVLR